MKLQNSKGNILIDDLEIYNTFFKRLKGLMFKKEIPNSYAVLIIPCSSIHTFFMKFEIGVIYLDKDNTVVKFTPSMKPFRLGPFVKQTSKVIEYDSKKTIIELKKGDKLNLI